MQTGCRPGASRHRKAGLSDRGAGAGLHGLSSQQHRGHTTPWPSQRTRVPPGECKVRDLAGFHRDNSGSALSLWSALVTCPHVLVLLLPCDPVQLPGLPLRLRDLLMQLCCGCGRVCHHWGDSLRRVCGSEPPSPCSELGAWDLDGAADGTSVLLERTQQGGCDARPGRELGALRLVLPSSGRPVDASWPPGRWPEPSGTEA